jgi:hypothetical protein
MNGLKVCVLLLGILMVKIEVGFAPEGFEKRMVQQTKDDLMAKLQGLDLGRVKIVFKKRPGHQLAFQFLGDPDAVDKTKQILGIYA